MPAWTLGFAQRKVTPEMGVALAGYGLQPKRTAEAVLDDLFARAIVLGDGARKVALCSVDVIGLSADLVQTVRKRVEKEAGIPPERVLLSAVHSHSTPTTSVFRMWGALSTSYVKWVAQAVGDAVVEAAQGARKVELGFGSAEVRGVAKNRVRADGPVDHTLRVLAAREPGAATPCLVAANFGCHPVCMDSHSRFVSADYPGRMLRDLKQAYPAAEPVFFQGCLGDINPERTHGGVDAAQDHGRRLAEAAAGILREMKYDAPAFVDGARVDLDLPLDAERYRSDAEAYLYRGVVPKYHDWIAIGGFMRDWAVEALALSAAGVPPAVRTEAQALRIGETVVVGLPGEIYTLIGDGIRKGLPNSKHVWVVNFSNANVGYICDPRDYPEESYAALMGPKIYGLPPFRPHAWEAAVRAGLDAAGKIL
ncbi:MAG: neutral/alkaline non-lysosomal ceramidase N-terminal domain-containing protein [Planctomycetota bacterium]|nr:neutral/alkaline non-lysosomal ceramidase N-terminal domain-containing protein [Planctomycetota bacterium]